MRFFALYWSQKVFVNPILSTEPVANIYGFDIPDPDDFEHEFLELKPLSSISDEELNRIEFGGALDQITVEFFPDNYNNHWVVKDVDGLEVGAGYLCCKDFDYLRSRGYALPYMGVSPDTLVEWGWVKLKTK